MAKALVPKLSHMSNLGNRKHYPKNNSFRYRWRVVDNFNKTVERDLFEQHLNGGAFHQSLQSEQILGLYKMTYRRRKNDFLSKLTLDAMSFLNNRRNEMSKAISEESTYTKSMATHVDSFFNVLLSCSIELNTVLGFSELFIAASEPEVKTSGAPGQTKVRSLLCRFSTSIYTLVIYGRKNKIDFYVLPVEELLGSRQPGAEHVPTASCVGDIVDGEVRWSATLTRTVLKGPYEPPQFEEMAIDEIDEDAMETICHYTLRELIEKTQQILAHTGMSTNWAVD